MKAKTVVLLAGGKSKRMGIDKRKLIFNGKPMLDHMISRVEELFEQVILVGDIEDAYEGRYLVVKDEIEGFGPLGGLYTALKYSQSQYVCLLPCDMPFINVDYIKYMQGIVVNKTFQKDILMTSYEGDMVEPFCAFYSKNILGFIEKMFEKKTGKLSAINEFAEVQYVKKDIAQTYSKDWKMFFNINTQEDLKLILKDNKG